MLKFPVINKGSDIDMRLQVIHSTSHSGKHIIRRLFLFLLIFVTVMTVSAPQTAFAMSENRELMYDYIAKEIKQHHAAKVDIEKFHIKTQMIADDQSYRLSYQTQLEFRHPELFYVQIDTCSWKPYTNEECTMGVTYLASQPRIRTMNRKYRKALNRIVAKAKKETSGKKQVTVVNREICRLCAYDSTGKHSHSTDAYGCLVNKKANCSGYALGAAACYNKLGIRNSFVYSYTKNHVWNKVKIGGKWYQVDTCWNDMGKTASSRYLLKTHLAGH